MKSFLDPLESRNVTKYLLQLICLKVLSRLEKVSVNLLPPGSEQTGNTNLMQEIESFDSPYQEQEGKKDNSGGKI